MGVGFHREDVASVVRGTNGDGIGVVDHHFALGSPPDHSFVDDDFATFGQGKEAGYGEADKLFLVAQVFGVILEPDHQSDLSVFVGAVNCHIDRATGVDLVKDLAVDVAEADAVEVSHDHIAGLVVDLEGQAAVILVRPTAVEVDTLGIAPLVTSGTAREQGGAGQDDQRQQEERDVALHVFTSQSQRSGKLAA